MVKLYNKIQKSTYIVVPSQIAINILGVVFTIILARLLSVEDFGIYNLFAGSLIVFSYFCNFGLASSLQRYIPEYASTKQYKKAFQLIKFAHYFRLVTSILLFLVAISTFDAWAPRFGLSNYFTEFCILALSAVLFFQIEYYQVDYSALFYHSYLLVTILFVVVIKIILTFLFLEGNYQVYGVFISELLANLIGFIVLTVLMLRIYIKHYSSDDAALGKTDKKRIARYSGYNALIGPGAILYSNSIDYLVVAYYINPLQLGVYALSSRVSRMILTVMPQNILQSVIRPAFYHHYSSTSDKNHELHLMFRRLVTLISFFMIPVLMLMIIIAQIFITKVFGDKYIDSVIVFQVMVFFSIFLVLEMPSDLVLQAIEMPQARLYAQIFSIYNLIAAIILVKIYGIIGVAVATGSATLLRCLFLYYLANKYTGITLNLKQMISIILYSIAALIPLYLGIQFSLNVIFCVILIAMSVIIYLYLFARYPFIDNYEKSIVNSYLKRNILN